MKDLRQLHARMPAVLSRRRVRLLAIGLLFGLLTACTAEDAAYSSRFYQVMRDTSGVYNGIELDDPLSMVLEQEDLTPTYDDSLGVLFRRQMQPSGVLETAYYTLPADSQQTLQAIVINIELDEQQQAKALFEEFARFYDHKFNQTAGGSYGNLSWRLPERGLLVELRFESLGNALTFNFSQLSATD